MPYIPIQLGNVAPAGTFEVFPTGLYTLRIKDSKQDTSKEGNAKLAIQYEIIDGPNGSQQNVRKNLPRSYSLLPQALPFLKRLVIAAGITDADIANAGGMLSDELLIGKTIRARVTVRMYQDREINEIQELYGDSLQQAVQEMAGQAPGQAPGLPAGAAPQQAYPPAPQQQAYPQAQQAYLPAQQPMQQPVQQPGYPPAQQPVPMVQQQYAPQQQPQQQYAAPQAAPQGYTPPQGFTPPAPVPVAGPYTPPPAGTSPWGNAAAPTPGFGSNGTAMAPQAPPQPPKQ